MVRRVCLCLAVVMGLAVGVLYAQDPAAKDEITIATELPMETQWIWGEVVSLDAQMNEVTIKYLDYETDQDKQMVVAVDDKTTYENVKSLVELKPNDTLSIDYEVTAEGKNLAKNIGLEKMEEEEFFPKEGTEPAPAEAPEAAVPVLAP